MVLPSKLPYQLLYRPCPNPTGGRRNDTHTTPHALPLFILTKFLQEIKEIFSQSWYTATGQTYRREMNRWLRPMFLLLRSSMAAYTNTGPTQAQHRPNTGPIQQHQGHAQLFMRTVRAAVHGMVWYASSTRVFAVDSVYVQPACIDRPCRVHGLMGGSLRSGCC